MELLVKYIAGEASPEEAMVVEEWIQAAPENKQQFIELQKVWMAAAPSENVYRQPEMKNDWQIVKQVITQTPVRNIKSRYTFSSLAAACIILLIGSLTWVLLKQQSNGQTEVVTLVAQTMRQEQLPDQSRLTLDANSTVTYKKDFGKAARNLTLQGECFFQVTHNPNQPFVIDMDGVKLQVLGTSFRVHNNIPAQKVDVDVATGKVMLYNDLDTLLLQAGQSGSYDRREKRFIRLDTVNVNNYSYATKQFSFADTPLDKVATYLEKTYKVKIKFQNQAIKACRLSAQFDQQPIDDILDVVASTFGISYNKRDNTIYLEGKGCQ